MRYGFIALALALFAQPAFAQTATQHQWAGFYGGVEAGLRHSRYDFSWNDQQNRVASNSPGPGVVVAPFNTVTSAGGRSSTDAIYGGLIGWSGQSGHFVYGLEMSAHLGGISDVRSQQASNQAATLNSLFVRDEKTRFDAALRARAGYAFGRTLLYGSGGVISQRIRLRVAGTYNSVAQTVNNVAVPAIGPVVTSGSDSKNFTGWTAGGGIEQRISGHFSIGLDAHYDRLGGGGFSAIPNQTTTAPASTFYGGGAGAALPAPPTSTVGATGHDPKGDMAVTMRLVFHF